MSNLASLNNNGYFKSRISWYCKSSFIAMVAMGAGIALSSTAHAQVNSSVEQSGGGAAPSDGDPIIVTGTYLRSDFPPSSPVDVLGDEIFDARPTTSVADAVASLPYVVTGGGGRHSSSNINLRGLGADATLVLLNGRRQVRVPTTSAVVDVNTMVPQIMIRNIDILKDGASALYGSDAVAGVVNLRTDNNFEGLELMAEGRWHTSDEERKEYSPFLNSTPGIYRGAVKMGAESDNANIVVAAEYSRRDRISSVGMPGVGGKTAYVPVPGQITSFGRDINGDLTSIASTIADPDCGLIPSTMHGGSQCLYNFNEDQTYLSDQERAQTFLRGEYRFSPSLKFVVEGGYSHQETVASETASPSISMSPALFIPGENPAVQALGGGLLYRARNSAGDLLYAVADATDPTRPARDASGQVVVAGTDPTLGIAFWEDVVYAGRVISSQGGMPTGGSLVPGEYAHANATTDTADVFRISLGFEGDLFNVGDFEWQAFYTRAQYDLSDQIRDIFPSQLRLAAQGFAGGACNALIDQPGVGNCSYFNPFISSALVSAGSAAANTQATIDYFYKPITTKYQTSLDVVDVLLNGTLFSLPAGDVSAAFGGQFRREEWAVNFAENLEVGNTANGTVSSDINASQKTWSMFGEIAVPIFDSSFGALDISAATRYEKGEATSTVDPKIGFTYVSPGSFVTIRSTWGQSFLAPNLYQQYTRSAGLANVNSTYGGTTVSTLQPRIATVETGNNALDSQKAEAWNIGAVFNPIDRLRLSVDRWSFSYANLITRENPQTLVNADDASLAAGTGPTGKVMRDAAGNVLQVRTTFFNAASLETSGIDFQASYWHDLAEAGRLDFNASATVVDKYSYQANASNPPLDLTGNWNATNASVAASVKLRAVFGLGWSLDNHAARIGVNYVGGVRNDQANAAIAGDDRFSPQTTVDVSYSLTLPRVAGAEEAVLSFGVSNLFNARAEQVSSFGNGLAQGIYDYLGRNVWARVGMSF